MASSSPLCDHDKLVRKGTILPNCTYPNNNGESLFTCPTCHEVFLHKLQSIQDRYGFLTHSILAIMEETEPQFANWLYFLTEEKRFDLCQALRDRLHSFTMADWIKEMAKE